MALVSLTMPVWISFAATGGFSSIGKMVRGTNFHGARESPSPQISARTISRALLQGPSLKAGDCQSTGSLRASTSSSQFPAK